MSKQEYRSEIAILGEIISTALNGGRDGVLVSKISRYANLSHYTALKKCDKLIDAGILELVQDGRNKLFVVSDRGIVFFNEFKRFHAVVTSLNLKC